MTVVATAMWVGAADGQLCPASIPAATFTFPQLYNGNPQTFDWLISLTEPSTATPAGDAPCASGVYIGQYSAGASDPSVCITNSPNVTVTGSGCKYIYTQADGSYTLTFDVTVDCDPSATTLTAPSAFVVTGGSGSTYTYTGTFKSADVCAATTTPTAPPPPPPPPPTTAAPAVPTEALFIANGSSTVDNIRVGIANAINVSVSSVVFVSDTTDDDVRTVVFTFVDYPEANAAIAKANDGSLADVGVSSASATHQCPTTMGSYMYSIPVSFNGEAPFMSFQWLTSFTTPSNRSAWISANCTSDVYVAQSSYDDPGASICFTSAPTAVVTGTGCKYTFVQENSNISYTLDFNVDCDESATYQQPPDVTPIWGDVETGFAFSGTFISDAVCKPKSPPTPPSSMSSGSSSSGGGNNGGGHCPASLDEASFYLPFVWDGTETGFDFVISLTTPSSNTPHNDAPCPSPVYFGQYNRNHLYTPSWCVNQTAIVTPTDLGCMWSFPQNINNHTLYINMTVECDPTAITLQPPSEIVGTLFDDTHAAFTGTFKSATVCGEAPNASSMSSMSSGSMPTTMPVSSGSMPTTMPMSSGSMPTTMPMSSGSMPMSSGSSAGQGYICPASIPAATFTFPQVFNGNSENYDWLISLTEPSTATPAGDAPCASGVYIGQYSPGAIDPAACITNSPNATVTGSGCKFSYSQTDGGTTRVFDVTVDCDPSATVLTPPSAFVATGGSGYIYTYTGTFKSADVCGAAPTTMPVSSGSMPTTMPVSSGSMPVSSGSMPMSSGSMPTTMPVSSGSMPMSSGSKPMSSGSMPMSSGSMPTTSTTTTTTTTTSTTTTTAAPTANEVAFAVNATVAVSDIRVGVANAINVSVSSVIFVSDSNPPSLRNGLLGDAGRTVVFRFEDSTAANAAIAKANDGTLASLGVSGASAVSPSAPKDDDDDGKKKTIIIAVVVSVVVVALIAVVSVIVYKKSKGASQRDTDQNEEMVPSDSNFGLPRKELA